MNITRRLLRDSLLAGTALVLLTLCVLFQKHHYASWHVRSGKYIQKVNLPNAEIIKIAAIGYDNLYADFLTLRAIQAFGAAWDTDTGEVEPIYNYFDILTTLDPHFVDVYELGHLVIADDRRSPDLALQLIRKGSNLNPHEWRIPYLGLYSALYDLKEPRRGYEFLHRLKRIPSTPEHVLRLEEYIERQSGQYHVAFDVNLGHYLRYLDFNMEVETRVAYNKFRIILDGWYQLELARAAEAYLEKHGEHPTTIEQMLADPVSVPMFVAPSLDKLLDDVITRLDHGGRLEPHRDEIRENAMTEFVGLPPEPNGTWYYISPAKQNDVRARNYDADAPLADRFGYFDSAAEIYMRLDVMALGIQEIIQKETIGGEPPAYDILAPYLREDGFGGHWVYTRDPVRIFSTTQKRRLERTDLRFGMRGLLEDFPRRPYILAPDQPPYLTTHPDIWDYPDDIEWALCKGLIPGIPFEEQPEDVKAAARSVNQDYLPCSDHVALPVERESF
ncbi:MAG: hypothetical protein KF858_00160 [Candidatus Sumerlaeia bacterium]|nr:hypothetical protein [Candidatus Sumerlaeia bacterium]